MCYIAFMRNEVTSSDSVRIPVPKQGVVTKVQRYKKDRAVIVHPSDFERLELLDSLLAEVSTAPPLRGSELADRLYIEESTPGGEITDAETVRRLFS